jgi:hypothetical protein
MKSNSYIVNTVFFLAAAALLSSCVQISSPGKAVDPTPPPANPITGSVALSVVTASLGGTFSPKNIVALWVEDSTGAFVKTLGLWAAARKQYLYTWQAGSGGSTVDAVTAATRSGHSGTLSVSWNGKNAAGAAMGKDKYRLRGELTDHNGAGATFSVAIDASAGAATASAGPVAGFASVSASYAP